MQTEMQKQKKHEKTKQHKSLKYFNPHFLIQRHEYDKDFQSPYRKIYKEILKLFFNSNKSQMENILPNSLYKNIISLIKKIMMHTYIHIQTHTHKLLIDFVHE